MKQKSLVVYFFLGTLEAVLALVILATYPSDGKNTLIFGFSLPRILLMTGILGVGIAFYYAGWDTQRKAAWTQALSDVLRDRLEKGENRSAAFLGCAWLAGAAGYLVYLIQAGHLGVWQASLDRLLPIIGWFFFLCLQSGIFLYWNFFHVVHRPVDNVRPNTLALSAVGVFLVLSLAAFIWWSRYGLQPDVVAWGAAGTPVLFWQVLVAFLGGAALLWFFLLQPGHPRRGDLILSAALWLGALIFWGLTPLKPSYFAPAPVLPNLESYPYSDASLHDMIAQNLLIGEGLGGDGGKVVRRPLYALFLAGLHGLAGQDYTRLVLFQVAVLAILPALIYLLCASLHSRLAGWVGGCLFIFQEHNAISLSGVINVSHSKLLMSDLPAALVISLFCLLVMRWLRSDGRRMFLPLLAGGALGAAVLIRPQSVVLFGAALLATLLCRPGKPADWLKGIVFLSLGLLLCVLPWIIRNWDITGGFVFDEPSDAQIGMVARRYSLDPKTENGASNQPSVPANDYSSAMSGQILAFTLNHPQEVLRFTMAHFMHNIVNLAAALPLSADSLDGEVYIRSQPFWLDPAENPQAQTPFANTPMLILNLILLGIGLGSAIAGRDRRRWAGFLPLLIYIAYNISNALARNSGWRFLLPGDWVVWIYLACGLGQVLIWGVGAVTHLDQDPLWFTSAIDPEEVIDSDSARSAWRKVALSTGLIILLGGSIPLAEALIPRRYEPQSVGTLFTQLRIISQASQEGAQLDVLESLAKNGKVVVLEGRALYPRYYRAGRGITAGSPSPLTAPMDFNRLTFHLAGPINTDVVLPIQNPPRVFPHAADVVVIGCFDQGRLNAFLAAGISTPDFLYEQDIAGQILCPKTSGL